MIAHSLRQARTSGLFDVIAVSSDLDEILTTAQSYGVDVVVARPADLATDTAAKLPVIRHCVAEVEQSMGVVFDTCVDLDATSPLRLVNDIDAVVKLLENTGAGNVITAMPARRSPYFNMVEVDSNGIVGLAKPSSPPFTRRQDAPTCYDMNASIYAWTRQALMSAPNLFNPDTRLYVMPEERSIDIDSEIDFQFVEFLMARVTQLDMQT